jgi:hypothetical protein
MKKPVFSLSADAGETTAFASDGGCRAVLAHALSGNASIQIVSSVQE